MLDDVNPLDGILLEQGDKTGRGVFVATVMTAQPMAWHHMNTKSVGVMVAPFAIVMVSTWASRPDTISHWSVAPT
jgi:hypothetical protein